MRRAPNGTLMKIRLPDNLEKNAISVLLGIMASLMITAAFCRHLLPEWRHLPLAAAGGCLTWIASLGMARAAALGLHVRMSVLERAVDRDNRRRLTVFSDGAFMIFAAFTLVVGCAVLASSFINQRSPAHPLVYTALPVGSILTMIRLVRRMRGEVGTAGK